MNNKNSQVIKGAEMTSSCMRQSIDIINKYPNAMCVDPKGGLLNKIVENMKSPLVETNRRSE